MIDTAEAYGTEEVVGEAIRSIRDQVFVATKVSAEHFRRRDVIDAADNSLRRLGIDVIDLYQLHWPSPSIPIGETMQAMDQLVSDGKIQHIGVSNFSIDQLAEAQDSAEHRIVANQLPYSLADRTIEDGLLAYCQKNAVTIIAYSPLAQGLENLQ